MRYSPSKQTATHTTAEEMIKAFRALERKMDELNQPDFIDCSTPWERMHTKYVFVRSDLEDKAPLSEISTHVSWARAELRNSFNNYDDTADLNLLDSVDNFVQFNEILDEVSKLADIHSDLPQHTGLAVAYHELRQSLISHKTSLVIDQALSIKSTLDSLDTDYKVKPDLETLQRVEIHINKGLAYEDRVSITGKTPGIDYQVSSKDMSTSQYIGQFMNWLGDAGKRVAEQREAQEEVKSISARL